jgi:hypothetical protein
MGINYLNWILIKDVHKYPVLSSQNVQVANI